MSALVKRSRLKLGPVHIVERAAAELGDDNEESEVLFRCVCEVASVGVKFALGLEGVLGDDNVGFDGIDDGRNVGDVG